MPVNTIEVHVGRLVEIRHFRGFENASDVGAVAALVAEVLAKIPPDTRVVTVADWRGCSLMSPETAERTLELLRRGNPHIERAGILSSEHSPISVMQMLRLLRDAPHGNRRVFSDPDGLIA